MFGWLRGMDGKKHASCTTKLNMRSAAIKRATGVKKAPKPKKLKLR